MKNIFVSSIRDEAAEIFKLAEEFQLGIEIQGFIKPYMIKNFPSVEKATKERLLNIQQRSMHGPFIDLFPASKDPSIVAVVKNRFLDAYKTAKTLNAKHLIFHAGFIPKAYYPKDWLDNCIVFWKDFLSDIGEDIEIHIENVCEDDFSLINDLIESVKNPIFSACLDIGHVNVNSSKSLEHWIKGLNSNIKYVHLHNNDGLTDSHYGLCKGQINILQTLALLETYSPDAAWSLETKLTETRQSVLLLEENGFIKKVLF
jgi:sugar phosphate isomerase/epimerase